MREEKRILLVCHDPTSRLVEILETSLATYGYRIMTTVQTGPGLESVVTELMPHMVVVDFSLSYLEGIRISLQVRQWSDVPVLIVTPNKAKPNAVSTLSLNRRDFLSDPLDTSALSTLVAELLGPDTAQCGNAKTAS